MATGAKLLDIDLSQKPILVEWEMTTQAISSILHHLQRLNLMYVPCDNFKIKYF
ncbi:hypothetical protein SLEP1_g31947 [Rubroshorea leprosula]|uniref:Uncharacterized protein n=1 Tax=Rubroshorea leprosula TaxID=152421 RepID=A0AAV5KBU9_9ROSI|nr:hypothetical protein SLEP1_g31947 [Rubroshorea leprosula]